MSEYIVNQSSKPRFCLIPSHYDTLTSAYIWTIAARCGVTHTCVKRHRPKLREVAPVRMFFRGVRAVH